VSPVGTVWSFSDSLESEKLCVPIERRRAPLDPSVITFIHTADWQIGKPFASIADPAKRARVQQERIEAIRRIGGVVRERRAAFVVMAGDLFDSPTPTNATVAAALGAIAAIEVPVYCIPGNHDHGGPDSLWEQSFFKREHRKLAANFQLLLEPEPVVVDLPGTGLSGSRGPDASGDPISVVLLPCPLRRRHETDDPTAWIRTLDFTSFGDRPRIVIAHGSTTVFAAGGSVSGSSLSGPRVVSGSTNQADEEEPAVTAVNTLALDRLPLDQLDYLALGDWHGFLPAGPKAFYSGAPEIDRFPKPGQRPGHVAVVTTGRGAEPRVEPVATGKFRWLVHTLALGDEGPLQLDDWLSEATRPVTTGEASFDACLARLELSGCVSLAQRAELDMLVESWTARLLRLDLDDQTVLAPSPEEIRELAERPGDPIIARVAESLVAMLEGDPNAAVPPDLAGGQKPVATGLPDADVIRHAIHLLHSLVSASEADREDSPPAAAQSHSPVPTAAGTEGSRS
jgi:DNA repair exonuclease SbcCD nuclease subunit